ncbi:hypothetical protein DFH07DRAFT_965670 [Mycena maculata]|uniref:Uncharacterized protein n=1 Tax=Mycena maculata TaxID=230809 RepID=A0AAD7IC02_9AGAR|nr:hypothetical protein DFH07DRAFT_965670 [Mycena maculata]
MEHLGILPSSGFPQAPLSDPGDKSLLTPILLCVLPVRTLTMTILVSSHHVSHSAVPPRVDSIDADLRKICSRVCGNAQKLNNAFVLSTDCVTHGVDDYPPLATAAAANKATTILSPLLKWGTLKYYH